MMLWQPTDGFSYPILKKAFSAVPKGRFRYALSAKSGTVLGNSTDICRGAYEYLFYQCLPQAAFRKEFVPYTFNLKSSINFLGHRRQTEVLSTDRDREQLLHTIC